nr:uncharacterized mitochondrial protein AtMg00810-like [Tanacetum cinerariifolium]
MMGEPKFFLRLQVHQSPRGIFISQSQYAIELLKKHGMNECVSMSIPMATERLDTDLQGTLTDQTTYRRMIEGLMYLTASHPDIAFATFICARYLARPMVRHLKEVRRIFRYLRTEYQLANLFTKALLKECFEYLVHRIEFIMAQPQRLADVHQDELCPPNKSYALMDANKNINLDNPLYSNERKLMENIIQNHLLRFNIAASSFVPWIYMGQFWHTLQEDRSKYRLKLMLDRKEITLTLNDFKRIFHLPQATDNNHERFFCCSNVFRNEEDAMVKNIFNSRKHNDGVGMKIPSWMITDEMKLIDHYWMYAVVFRVDVPTTQSQPIESTQGTHRTTSSPRSLNPETNKGESSAPQKSIVIRLQGAKNVKNVEVNSSTLRQDDTQTILETRLEPKSDKESPKVEIIAASQPVNVIEEEKEPTEDDYELRRREKGKHVEESRST